MQVVSTRAASEGALGRYDDSLRDDLKIYELAARTRGTASYFAVATLADAALAQCLIEQGDVNEAAKRLENIDVDAVAQLTGSKDWFAALELSKAKIAFRRGDYDSARKYLAAATPVFSRADAEPYQRNTLQKLALALNR